MRFEQAAYYQAALVQLQDHSRQVDPPTHEVLWHEQRDDYAAVLASTDSHSSEHIYLLLRRLENFWVPVQRASTSNWVAYDERGSIGAFMDASHTADSATQRLRVKLGDMARDVAVVNCRACIVLWDIQATEKSASIEFLEVEMHGKRTPCIISSLPMTANQFGVAYLIDNEWGWFEIREAKNREDRLKLIMAVVQQAQLPQDERALGGLGAGPLEDMMSEWLLDQLEKHVPFDANLRLALSQIRMEFEPEHLQERLRQLQSKSQ